MKTNSCKKIAAKKYFSSLKMELFYYFSIFAVIMIVLLWIFQIGFLNATYGMIRANQIYNTGNQLSAQINASTFEEIVENATLEKTVSVIIYDSFSNQTIAANTEMMNRNLNHLDNIQLYQLLSTIDEGERLVVFLNNDGSQILKADNSLNLFDSYFFKNEGVKGIIYITATANQDGHLMRMLVYGSVSPVSSITETLSTQLRYISVILLIVALILAFVAGKFIAKPIAEINEDAKKLSKGDYSVDFMASGYTEIEELSETMMKLSNDLAKVDQMQKELIANVSHDLRTPLTMISGYGEVMRDIPGENTPENVQVIIDEANRLTSLVNNLLDISKLQSGTVNLSVDVINTKDLMYDVINTYSKLLENKGYSIDFEDDGKNYYVQGDKQRLQQAMYNIINNAINHAGQDKKVIIALKKMDNSIRISITDHGEGIPEDELDLIWQRYYKVDKKHTRPETGSGLGLSIVKTIFELHKAKYGVNSKINEGTTFWFELPIVEVVE